ECEPIDKCEGNILHGTRWKFLSLGRRCSSQISDAGKCSDHTRCMEQSSRTQRLFSYPHRYVHFHELVVLFAGCTRGDGYAKENARRAPALQSEGLSLDSIDFCCFHPFLSHF